ncbi:MAG: cell division protein FtsA [Geminicoccaceae bacterium]
MGTSKLCCYIARPRPGRGVQLLGRGYQVAEGLKAGEIVDAEAAESSVLATLHEAEQQSGETLREIVLAVSGGRPQSTFVRVACQLHGRAVTDADVQLLLDRARHSASTPEREVLHAVPIELTVDGGRPLKDPRGLSGQRLEIVAHLVSMAGPALRNVLACLERCHVEVKAVVCASYAAGLACLAQDEIERGCLVLDMGGGSTGLTHYADGRLTLVEQVPYGGDHITGDLAFGLSTSRHHAERIKNLFGGAQFRSCDDGTRIEVPILGDHADMPTGEVPRTRVTEIVRARAEEILILAKRRLDEHRELLLARPARSIVLTGGGSQLEGLEELVQETFRLPTRRGRPGALQTAQGLEDQPCCATAAGAVGLVLGDDGGLGWRDQLEVSILSHRLARLGQWFRENF